MATTDIVTLRCGDRLRTRIELAAQVAGVSRSEYIRRAVAERADADLARLTQRHEPPNNTGKKR